jgi:hypothetical protein
MRNKKAQRKRSSKWSAEEANRYIERDLYEEDRPDYPDSDEDDQKWK